MGAAGASAAFHARSGSLTGGGIDIECGRSAASVPALGVPITSVREDIRSVQVIGRAAGTSALIQQK